MVEISTVNRCICLLEKTLIFYKHKQMLNYLDHGMGIEKGPIFWVPWSPSPDRMKFAAQGFSMVLNPNLVVAKL